MTVLGREEIEPGLVVYLDPAVLTAEPGCTTNARLDGGRDRAVSGPHFFLVLLVDAVDDQVLAVPLFSRGAPGSIRLDDELKAGPAARWQDRESHFSRWQHWWIPAGRLVSASESDETEPGWRRSYAGGSPGELDAIAAWRHRNSEPWRGL